MAISGDITTALGTHTSGFNSEQTKTLIDTAFNGAVDAISGGYDPNGYQLNGRLIEISDSDWIKVSAAIEALMEKAQQHIDKFNDSSVVDVSSAIQGDTKAAVEDYIDKCKLLLTAYVSQYRHFIADANEARRMMLEGDVANAAAVNAGTGTVEELTTNLTVDEIKVD